MKIISGVAYLYLIIILFSSCKKDPSEQKIPDELQNPGFENSLSGWQVETTGGFTTSSKAVQSGQSGLLFTPSSIPWNGSIFQTLRNLPDGNYSFSVYGKASGVGMYLWADGGSNIVSTPFQKAFPDSTYPLPLNTLDFTVTNGVAKIGFICINALPDTAKQPISILEAESAVLNKAVVSTIRKGFTGTGFVDFINSSGDFIEWAINKVDSGSVLLQFRYANGSIEDRPLKLEVNNVEVNAGLSFPPTGSWTKWSTVVDTIQLAAGSNKIKLTAIGSSGANIDHLSWQNILSMPFFYADDVQIKKTP